MNKVAIINHSYLIRPGVGLSSLGEFENKVAKAFRSIGFQLRVLKKSGRNVTLSLEPVGGFLGKPAEEQTLDNKFERAVKETLSSVAYQKAIANVKESIKEPFYKDRVLTSMAQKRYQELVNQLKKG